MTESLSRAVIVRNDHKKKLALVPPVMHNWTMVEDSEYPYFEQGRRLRWLRQAEQIATGTEFARKFRWTQSAYSHFETGKRRLPGDKGIQLAREIPGFNPMYIWENHKNVLSFDLRQRIEAEEAKESQPDAPQLARGEGHDV